MNYLKFKKIIFTIQFFLLVTFSLSNNNIIKDNKILYIGILETKNMNWPDDPDLDNSVTKRIVKVLFYKSESRWQSLKKEIANKDLYPDNVFWTIAFDGKKLGKFRSESTINRFDAPWTFPRDTYQRPLSPKLPIVGKSTNEFAGWSGYAYPRPLVVVSGDNYMDPEGWKPFVPNDSLINIILPKFRKYLLKYRNKFSVNINGIKKLKSYISNSDRALIQIGISEETNNRNNLILPTWFFLNMDSTIINLSEMIDAPYKKDDFYDDDESNVKLVDAGDYDGDSESEIIFWVERYNCDGYVIFYNECNAFAEFSWHYH